MDFRDEIAEQIVAMSRFLLSNESKQAVGDSAKAVLCALDRGEKPAMEDLISGHAELKALVAPATPAALAARAGRTTEAGFGRFLGPNPVVRNLALTNLFFLLTFLGISLSPLINEIHDRPEHL